MSKNYKYYDEEQLQTLMNYISDSAKLIGDKFSFVSPKGYSITEEESYLIKHLLFAIELVTKDISDQASLIKLKHYNMKLRKYYGLEQLDTTKIQEIKQG